jgi:hypothetical protein
MNFEGALLNPTTGKRWRRKICENMEDFAICKGIERKKGVGFISIE